MRRVTAGTVWMSRAVCVRIRACGRIVGEGILTQYGACTLHEHCRSHLLDRAKFLFAGHTGQPVLASNVRGVITRWRLVLAGRWLERARSSA